MPSGVSAARMVATELSALPVTLSWPPPDPPEIPRIDDLAERALGVLDRTHVFVRPSSGCVRRRRSACRGSRTIRINSGDSAFDDSGLSAVAFRGSSSFCAGFRPRWRVDRFDGVLKDLRQAVGRDHRAAESSPAQRSTTRGLQCDVILCRRRRSASAPTAGLYPTKTSSSTVNLMLAWSGCSATS